MTAKKLEPINRDWIKDIHGQFPALLNGQPFRDFLEDHIKEILPQQDADYLIRFIIKCFDKNTHNSLELVEFFKDASTGNLDADAFDTFLEVYVKELSEIINYSKTEDRVVLWLLIILTLIMDWIQLSLVNQSMPQTYQLLIFVITIMINASTLSLGHFVIVPNLYRLRGIDLKSVLKEIFVTLNTNAKEKNSHTEDSDEMLIRLAEAVKPFIEETASDFQAKLEG